MVLKVMRYSGYAPASQNTTKMKGFFGSSTAQSCSPVRGSAGLIGSGSFIPSLLLHSEPVTTRAR